MCMCCGLFATHAIPFRMLWSLTIHDVIHIYIYIYLNLFESLILHTRDVAKTGNYCGRSKAPFTEHHGKCPTCKSFVKLGFWWRKTNRTARWLIPSAVSVRRAGVEQLFQVKGMIGGIGNMLFSIYSQTENVQDPRVFLVNLWGQVITLRGPFLGMQNWRRRRLSSAQRIVSSSTWRAGLPPLLTQALQAKVPWCSGSASAGMQNCRVQKRRRGQALENWTSRRLRPSTRRTPIPLPTVMLSR